MLFKFEFNDDANLHTLTTDTIQLKYAKEV